MHVFIAQTMCDIAQFRKDLKCITYSRARNYLHCFIYGFSQKKLQKDIPEIISGKEIVMLPDIIGRHLKRPGRYNTLLTKGSIYFK